MKPLFIFLALIILFGFLIMRKAFKPVNELVIQELAKAIARAEGFFVIGSRPAKNHNPGNLTVDIAGGPKAVGKDGMYVVYATDADGWEDLRGQVRLMFNGGSNVYNSEMTIQEMANRYTATEQTAWAANVARSLGVPVTTRLKNIATTSRLISIGG